MKELAKEILDKYHNEDLWKTKQNQDGKWEVQKNKLSDDLYKQGMAELNKCNENGFRPGDEYYEKQ